MKKYFIIYEKEINGKIETVAEEANDVDTLRVRVSSLEKDENVLGAVKVAKEVKLVWKLEEFGND